MGKHFGELATLRGIITYKLSPFEQRAFAGAVSKGVPNFARRIGENLIKVVPPFLFTYLIYTTAEAKHEQLMRKNPDDYKDDV